jgi:hypothetical protein
MKSIKNFFSYYAITKVYIAKMRSLRQVILKFILSAPAKKSKLAVAQTCFFLNAAAKKINFELLRLVQMHSAQYILLLA